MKKLTQADFNGLDEKWVFLGVDSQGVAYKFKEKPVVDDGGYYEKSWSFFGEGYDTADWQDTLIEREVKP